MIIQYYGHFYTAMCQPAVLLNNIATLLLSNTAIELLQQQRYKFHEFVLPLSSF